MFDDVELSADELFNDPRFRIVEAVEESKAINPIKGGAIIMSASGMCDAGRIKHHLANNLPRANATVLFVGYQAPGTLGQIILSGAKTVRIHGEEIPVRARIRSMGNYSAHADHSELMAWITARLPAHGAIFLTHGEDEERTALRQALLASGIAGDQVILPLLDDAVELHAGGERHDGAARAAPHRPQPAQRRLAQRLFELRHRPQRPPAGGADRCRAPRADGRPQGQARRAAGDADADADHPGRGQRHDPARRAGGRVGAFSRSVIRTNHWAVKGTTAMFIFVGSRRQTYLLRHARADGRRPRWIGRTYHWLFRTRRLPAATYVFVGVDRLDNSERRLAASFYRHINGLGHGWRALNDPAIAMGRYRLLRSLHEAGVNDFNAYLGTEPLGEVAFPCFIRSATSSRPPLTGLLANGADLLGAIETLVALGHPKEDLLVIEYCAEPSGR